MGGRQSSINNNGGSTASPPPPPKQQQQQQVVEETNKNQTKEEPIVVKVKRRDSIFDHLPITPDDDPELAEHLSGAFRGIAIAARKFAMVSKKVIIAKGPAVKSTIRSVGENRPLAFASEGAVAGDALLPRVVYYGAWTLSGCAIAADIYNKQDDAPTDDLKLNTVLYWTAFHIPASLVVPAVIIHQIVHFTEHNLVDNPKSFLNTSMKLSTRTKSLVPVAAAVISIIPVVPTVDYVFEMVMEPTLGSYLGLSFDHHHHDSHHDNKDDKTTKGTDPKKTKQD